MSAALFRRAKSSSREMSMMTFSAGVRVCSVSVGATCVYVHREMTVISEGRSFAKLCVRSMSMRNVMLSRSPACGLR